MNDVEVVRVWRTGIDPRRAAAYELFAHEKSLPMLRAQPGFAGVFFARQGDDRAVLTLWADRASAEALATSPSYRTTVAEIEASGLLVGESSVELYDVDEYAGPE